MSTIFQKHEDFLKRYEKKIKIKDGILFRGKIDEDDGCWDREIGNAEQNWQKSPRRYLYITKELPKEHKGWRDIRVETGKNPDGNVEGDFYENYIYHLYGMESVVSSKKVSFSDLSDSFDDAVRFFHEKAAIARINCNKKHGESNTSEPRLSDIIKRYKNILMEQIRILDADIIVCCGSSDEMLKLVYATYSDADFKHYNGGIHYSQLLKKIIVHSYHLSYTCYKKISQEDFYEDTMEDFAQFINNNPEFRTFR